METLLLVIPERPQVVQQPEQAEQASDQGNRTQQAEGVVEPEALCHSQPRWRTRNVAEADADAERFLAECGAGAGEEEVLVRKADDQPDDRRRNRPSIRLPGQGVVESALACQG